MSKSVYPWHSMKVGDCCDAKSIHRISHFKSVIARYAERAEKRTGRRPVFNITDTGRRTGKGEIIISFVYRIERTA